MSIITDYNWWLSPTLAEIIEGIYIYKKNKSSSVGESHQVQNWDMQYIASIQISKVFVRHIEIAKFAQYPKYLEPRKARDKGLEKD